MIVADDNGQAQLEYILVLIIAMILAIIVLLLLEATSRHSHFNTVARFKSRQKYIW